MPHYKLTYFKVKARAETARQILAIAGVDFEDVRVTEEQWLEEKPMPVLQVDGVKIAQSAAINRFLARQHALAGKSPIEEALVDSYDELFRDYMAEIWDYYDILSGWVKGDKKEAYNDKVKAAGKKFFNNIQDILAKSKSGFLASSGLTYVDLNIAEHLSQFVAANPVYLDGFPEETPQLKKWLETRPSTKF